MSKQTKPPFPLGALVATPNAIETIPEADIKSSLSRHIAGDWGDLDDEDLAANDRALIEGTRLFSAYNSQNGVRFWIITEADRSSTCVLLPQDY